MFGVFFAVPVTKVLAHLGFQLYFTLHFPSKSRKKFKKELLMLSFFEVKEKTAEVDTLEILHTVP